MKKGVFIISIDLELLWGRKDLDYSKFINKTEKERKIISKLLKLFKKYKIPVTWAFVGKLLEKDKDHQGPNWYGKDIINLISKEKIHELASHTYSHEDISEIPSEKAKIEFSKPKAFSIVFPRNHIHHLNLLKKSGIKAFRAKDKSEYELLIPRVPVTGDLKRVNSLIEIPSSMYFVSSRDLRKYIPSGLRLFKSKLGINKAISEREIFHIWFHPVDFADNTYKLLNEFESILKYAANKRSEGVLEIKTMKQIAQSYEKYK